MPFVNPRCFASLSMTITGSDARLFILVFPFDAFAAQTSSFSTTYERLNLCKIGYPFHGDLHIRFIGQSWSQYSVGFVAEGVGGGGGVTPALRITRSMASIVSGTGMKLPGR